MLGTYGGHLELSAFAHLKKRDVKVIQPGLVYVIEWAVGGSDAASGSGSSNEASTSGVTQREDRAVRRLRREKQREDQETAAAQAAPPVYVACVFPSVTLY